MPESISFFIPIAQDEMLSANRTRMKPGHKQRMIRNLQEKAIAHARAAGIDNIPTPARCLAIIQRPDMNRVYDPNNWNPTTKALVDGLVRGGILERDDANYLQGPDHRPGREGEKGVHLVFMRMEEHPLFRPKPFKGHIYHFPMPDAGDL